jgi:hypothetical protein
LNQWFGKLELRKRRKDLVVDKAYLVGVVDLHEMCQELRNYSLSVSGQSVTITRHDGGNGLNDIAFAFPIVAELSILSTLHQEPESGWQACLHAYTSREVRQSLYLSEDGKVLQDSIADWEDFWNPLEALLIREYETTFKF